MGGTKGRNHTKKVRVDLRKGDITITSSGVDVAFLVSARIDTPGNALPELTVLQHQLTLPAIINEHIDSALTQAIL